MKKKKNEENEEEKEEEEQEKGEEMNTCFDMGVSYLKIIVASNFCF